MRKIILYIAASTNGKIAREDGSVDWLDAFPPPEGSDYGYQAFYESIDTTIQGAQTYQQLLDWGIDFPYQGKKNFVFTRKGDRKDTEHVQFVRDNHLEFVKDLKQQPGEDIWLIGGGQVNTLLLNAQLIDEILLFVMPIVLPSGINLFEGIPTESQLNLVESQVYENGVTKLRYRLS